MARKRSHAVRAAMSPAADDFTLIKGIGPTLAARLHDTGILTFAQIAGLSPEDIATRVKGLSPRRITTENWIKQARKLVPKTTSVKTPASETIGEIRQHYATFTVELLLNEDNRVRRVRVTHVQNKVEETWAGWEEARLVNFFVRCSGLLVPQPELIPPPEYVSPPESLMPSSTAQTGLKGKLRLLDLVIGLVGSDMPQRVVHAGERFKVCLILDLAEVEASHCVPLTYTVAVWAKKLGDGSRQVVGEGRGTLMLADKVPCAVEVMMPSQGTYRLEAMVTLAQQGTELLPQYNLVAAQKSGLVHVY